MSVKIVRGSSLPIHVSKTITFDGTTGKGAVGTVTVFTVTGRVWLVGLCVFCTDSLTGAGATIYLDGPSAASPLMIGTTTATDIATGEWWTAATPPAGIVPAGTYQKDMLVAEDIIINVSTAAVTGGTLVIDAWYLPVTSDGALS